MKITRWPNGLGWSVGIHELRLLPGGDLAVVVCRRDNSAVGYYGHKWLVTQIGALGPARMHSLVEQCKREGEFCN